MARTASSNSTKPRKSKDNGSTHDGETKVQPELDLEPEPLWKKILLAIPRAFGSGVRAVTGVGEYDPAYRRDGLCFLLLVLAVLFCASEWFRVSGPFGQLLHAIAAGVLGLMSVVLPVLLAAVAFRLMRNSGKGSNNPRVVTGWVLLMWSICSIIDVAIAADHTGFDITILQSAGGLFGFFLGSPLAWGLSNVFAIIIFVVVGLFSLLMITGTHVTDLPEDARKIAAKIQRKPYVPMGQETDGSASQFPNEVRVEIPLSPLPTVFPRMTATMTEATTIRPAMRGPACSHDCSAANPRPKTTKLLTSMLPTIHSTVPPASMVPPPKPRWSIR